MVKFKNRDFTLLNYLINMLRRGAAVGLIYILGQAIGNALCATGFGESIAGLISETHSPLAERAIAAMVILLLTLINVAGVKWVIRLQFVLLVVLLLGAADFLVGSVTHTDEGWFMKFYLNFFNKCRSVRK